MPGDESAGEEGIEKEGIAEAIEITREQKFVPGKPERTAKTRVEPVIRGQHNSLHQTGEESGGSGVRRLPNQGRCASGAGQLNKLAVVEGGAGQRRLFAAATRDLAQPRIVPAGMMPKHVAERMTYGVTKGMSGETSPAEAATKVATRVTAAAAVLRMERSGNEECEENNK